MNSLKALFMKLQDDTDEITLKLVSGETAKGKICSAGEEHVLIRTGEVNRYYLFCNIEYFEAKEKETKNGF